MIVLGIHSGHDSSAAIVKDGKILADVQEERFVRVKHSNNIPLKSIAYCLKEAKLNNINEVDKISFSWKNNPKGLNTVFGLNAILTKKEKILKNVAKTFFNKSLGMTNQKLPIYLDDYTNLDKEKFINNDHHLGSCCERIFY